MVGVKEGAFEVARDHIDTWTRTGCPYCGVGCGLLVGTRDNAIVKVRGDLQHPSSFGDLCPKAVHLNKVIQTPDRLAFPLLRLRRDAAFVRASWDSALFYLTTRFRAILDRHGPEAVAFYGSGQLLTEEYYVANKLMKGFLGANNFDTNSRLCMASAVTGYNISLGSDGPPLAYTDLDCADFFFIIGANTAHCYPIIHRRMMRRKQQHPDTVRVIVVDPRRTETAEIANLYVPIKPGTDIALLNAMLHVVIAEKLVDEAFVQQHTEGWGAVKTLVQRYSPAYAEAICEVPGALITAIARDFAHALGAISVWSMGINQSTEGVHKNNALINLHLATGQIGKPGAGPFSLTGQPNAMGGREVGGLSHLLPGYRSVTNPTHRAEIARIWGVPVDAIAARPGYTAVELFEALDTGTLKAVWILATNPAVSMPELDLVERALRKAELVVVQDAYHPTDTSAFADVLLPAAQWSEKEGTMTNSERRITYLPKILEPPGEALPDWQIFTRFAQAMGFGASFPYTTAEEVYEEFKQCTKGRRNDITGVSYARLKQGPLQWPCPSPDSPGTERLYTDKTFATLTGKAQFIETPYEGAREHPDASYPVILTTGRVKNHWHTMTRTGKVEIFNRRTPEPFVEINTEDAAYLDIQDADFVEVLSKRGKLIARAQVTEKIVRGTCFVPFHWGRRSGVFNAANNLTLKAYDPVSQQPELKFAAVTIKKVMVDLLT